MLSFCISEKGQGIVSPPHFVYDFSKKNVSHLIYYNWPNFIIWYDYFYFLRYWAMCLVNFCFPFCDVMNSEINFIFLIKPLFYMTKNLRQKIKCLENEKSFYSEIRSIFHHFYRAFSCQKMSEAWKCTINAEAYSELCQTSNIVLFGKIVYCGKALTILVISFILDD